MTTPIIGLNHIELVFDDFATALGDYEALAGGKAGLSEGRGMIQLENVALMLRQGMADEGLGLLCFEVDELERMTRRLKRLGMTTRDEARQGSGARTVEIDRKATYSVPIGYRSEPRPGDRLNDDSGEMLGLDHVVIGTRFPDRAAALYGARLGLDLRMDAIRPQWGARLMFFRCGNLVLEVVHRLQEDMQGEADRLYGLSWRTADADKTHARLSGAGFDVSEIRSGRKPGTRIFTVRNRTGGIPTVFLQPPKA